MQFEGFNNIIADNWDNKGVYKNSAQDITARFKTLGKGLKTWSRNFSKLNKIIDACNFVLAMIDGLEEQRSLSLQEKNFRTALKKHLTHILEAKRLYWRSRAKIKWAQLGGENTKNFHTMATKSYRCNFIATLSWYRQHCL